jgi:nucleoside-diphosphate-sugar epimerase
MDALLPGCTALVTGAAGFIGLNLVARLLACDAEVVAVVRPGGNGHRLRAFDGRRLQIVPVDLTEPETLHGFVAKTRPAHVFHLATLRDERDPKTLLLTNVMAFAALVDAARQVGARSVVNAGSSLEYGDAATPYMETMRPEPATLFGASKAAAALIAEQQCRAGAVPVATLRLFHVYGPHESPTRLVGSAIRAALSGTELPLTRPGLTHDFVFVQDVVDALLRAAAAPPQDGVPVNICSGVATANEQVVDLVEEVTGRPVRRAPGQYPARPWDRRRWSGDPSRARQVLGWRPETSLREGLARTMQWMLAPSHG